MTKRQRKRQSKRYAVMNERDHNNITSIMAGSFSSRAEIKSAGKRSVRETRDQSFHDGLWFFSPQSRGFVHGKTWLKK